MKTIIFNILTIVFLFLSITAAHSNEDTYLWLESVDGEQALQWVKQANQKTEENLGSSELFNSIYASSLAALNNQDKLPDINIIGDYIYQLKKSSDHPRGIYLRTTLGDFKTATPSWQTVLDIDALSAQENAKWVFSGMSCVPPNYERCLIFLSPGGGDAVEMREFNATTLEFVKDGFQLPVAKMRVTWRDQDHLFVGTDFGAGSMTDSGYPRIIKIWQRGTALDSAKKIMQIGSQSVTALAYRERDEDNHLDLLVERLDYWNRQYSVLIDGEVIDLALPNDAVIEAYLKDDLIITLKSDWRTTKHTYPQGSVVLVNAQSLIKQRKHPRVTILRESKHESIIQSVDVSHNNIFVTVLQDVKSRIYRYQKIAGAWLHERVDLPLSGQLQIAAAHDTSGEFFARYEDFLTPPTLYSVDVALNSKKILQQSATFDSSDMQVEQFFATSKDGTRIPYFVIQKENLVKDGTNPTHMFSYGGFRASLTPSYSGSYEPHNGAYGKAWLERGGVYVIANIRGGAEYGPAWHAAALQENRHKAFEDFEAVAEDLIAKKITSAKHLGIEGRSNGGLLVAASMQRRPDLYGAVVCGVPLTDMHRYNKLLAGASWMAEYGNPDTDDWEFIKEYSPYQNLDKNTDYPPVFFFTSTRDDRVHPGHARKMAAKMQAMGHQIDYFENTEGGHKGSATAEQTARRIALSFTHLWRHLSQRGDN